MGEGFVLGTPRREMQTSINLTRDGSFQLDRLGNLVNTDGLPLLGEANTHKFPYSQMMGGNPDRNKSQQHGTIEATYGLDTTNVVGKNFTCRLCE